MATKLPDFRAVAYALYQLRQAWPTLAGGMAVQYSREAFRKATWDGQPWPDRKKDKAWSDGDRSERPNRALLIKTGRLRRSVRQLYARPGEVSIGTDVPYAAIHNDGGTIRGPQRVRAHLKRSKRGKQYMVKSHLRTVNIAIPKRQFLGDSREFSQKITTLLEKKSREIFNKL